MSANPRGRGRSSIGARHLLLLVGFCSAGGAGAASVPVSTYSMLNGQTGTWLYRDEVYLPCPGGACTTTLAPLSGGTGKLTDGVAPAASWNGSGAQPGTPVPWVGWFSIDPSITFNFAGMPSVSRVGLYLDNTPGTGDVRLPDRVSIGGASYEINTDPNFGPRWIYFDVAPVAANSLAIGLVRDAGRWIMLGEVSFESRGEPAIPEPGMLALFGVALSGLGLAGRRRT